VLTGPNHFRTRVGIKTFWCRSWNQDLLHA